MNKVNWPRQSRKKVKGSRGVFLRPLRSLAACLYTGFLMAGALQAATVAWDGTLDSNWNMATNWSSGLVPGTTNFDMAVLAGVADHAVIGTPVETTNSFSIKMRNEAQLRASREMARCIDVWLGSTAGSGGGHVIQDASITIADDLRIGHDAAATSDSSYRIMNGALAVADELYVDQGVLSLESSTASLAAGRMTLTTNAHLKIDFDVYGTSPIVVSNTLTIADGAKLEIDLRGYAIGGNSIELIQFGSVRGTFNPADVTITGLGGGTLTYGSNSLTLAVADGVQGPASALWFKAKPVELEVNTGRIIRNLSSTALTYTEAVVGDDLVYSISWAGSDFDGDNANDTISFDLRLEGFSGSSYTYSTNAASSSVTVGSSVGATAGSVEWGIGSDKDLDAGESLRFSVENMFVSASGTTATVDGFIAISFDELGGHSHKIIIGEGGGLDSFVDNNSIDYGLNAFATVTATSAGNSSGLGMFVESVALKVSVTNPSNPDPESDASDYSGFPVGPQMGLDYSAETNFLNYPEFSWDTLPRWASANGTLSSNAAQTMAAHHQIMSMGGFDTEDETIADSALLKFFNPDLKTLFYLNTAVNFKQFNADAFYNTNEWNRFTLDANGDRVYDKIRSYYVYNHDYAEMSEWWVDLAAYMVSQPEVDGVFIDKANTDGSFINKDGQFEAPVSGSSRSYYNLWNQVSAGTLVIGNALRNEREGGNRASMQLFSGSYIERWERPYGDSPIAQTVADARCVSIQLMREAALKGKILMPAFQDRLTNDELALAETELIALIRERVTLPLAYYLIVAEKYSYFRYQPDQNTTSNPEYIWDPTDYVEELTRPLGPPMGPPVKDGYIYTRSFEHVDVWLNVETDNPVLAWDSVDTDMDGMDDRWEYRNFGNTTNAVASANPDGDSFNNLEEYIAGLNPNVFDTFAVSNFTVGGSNTFEWSAASGRVYNAYWSSNLVDGFSLIQSNVPGGAYVDTDRAGDAAGFYKVTVGFE